MAKSPDPLPPQTRGCVQVKAGVKFTTIAPAGFRLLGAIERVTRELHLELTITSACDGEHSGPNDPHHRGEAYDVRTRGLSDVMKDAVVRHVLLELRDDEPTAPQPVDGITRGLVTARFFGFVEAVGTPNEHLHFQLRRARVYP